MVIYVFVRYVVFFYGNAKTVKAEQKAVETAA